MRESQYIRAWIEEGKQEGRLEANRSSILQVLRARFKAALPDDVRATVEGTNDLDTLSRWLKTAATVNSLDEFRAALT